MKTIKYVRESKGNGKVEWFPVNSQGFIDLRGNGASSKAEVRRDQKRDAEYGNHYRVSFR